MHDIQRNRPRAGRHALCSFPRCGPPCNPGCRFPSARGRTHTVRVATSRACVVLSWPAAGAVSSRPAACAASPTATSVQFVMCSVSTGSVHPLWTKAGAGVTHHSNAQLTPVNVHCLMVFMLFVSIFIFAGVFLSIFLFFYLFLLLYFSRGIF